MRKLVLQDGCSHAVYLVILAAIFEPFEADFVPCWMKCLAVLLAHSSAVATVAAVLLPGSEARCH